MRILRVLGGVSLLLGLGACGGGGLPSPGPVTPARGLTTVRPGVIDSEAPATCTIEGWGLSPVGRTARVRFHAGTGTPFAGGTLGVVEQVGTIASSASIECRTPVFGTSVRVDAVVEVILPDGSRHSVPSGVTVTIRPPTVAEAGMFDRTPLPGEMLSATGEGFGPIDGEISFVLEALAGMPFEGGDSQRVVLPGRVVEPGVVQGRLAPEPITDSFEARLLVVFPSGATATGPTLSFTPGVFRTSPTTGQETGFGAACAVQGGTAVFGAPAEEAAYVHVRGSGTWPWQATLRAASPSPGDRFGATVDVDGDTAVVGAPGADSAYVFARTGTTWTQMDVLTLAIDPLLFGTDVAVSGDRIAVAQGTLAGAVYVYARLGGVWGLEAVVHASDGGARAFGHSIALEGTTLAVGAPQDDTRGEAAGALYVFSRSGTSWTQTAKVLAPDGTAHDALGSDIGLASHVLVGGAPGDVATAHPSGAAHVFTRLGFTWTRAATLGDALAGPAQLYGVAVAVSTTRVVVGAPSDGGSAGVAFLYDQDPVSGAWSRSATLKTWWPGALDARLGHAVGIDADDVVVGVPILEGEGFACIY